MRGKSTVRERRMDKIRKLQEGAAYNSRMPESRAETEPLLGVDLSEDYRAAAFFGRPEPARSESARLDPRVWGEPEQRRGAEMAPDPEIEWNRKLHREWSQYDRYGGGGGHGPETEHPWIRRFAARLLVSGLLFGALWAMYQWDHPLAVKGRGLVTAELNRSYDGNALAAWYEQRFGSIPSFLPALNPAKHTDAAKVSAGEESYFLPVQGRLIAPFTPVQGGVLIEAKEGAPVAALATGLVEYVGEKENSGYTVILRHADGMLTEYGHLEKKEGRIAAGDWIKGGETIGTVAAAVEQEAGGALFFSVTRGGKAVDPLAVISFD